jgi:16S rRNA (cytidine1402-2'-O)-methyltransferase
MGSGTLYIVGTPIGNLEDITLRALRVLKEVGLIAAEDTRRTKKLAARYSIKTPMTSCFEHNEAAKAPVLIGKLKEGMDVALVSDAGTPTISDPGYRLIKLALENSIPVVSVPGPSALTSSLSISGLPPDRFTFLGFVPTGVARRRAFFTELKGTRATFVMYESARRVATTLVCIQEVLGECGLFLAREMTKLHEELIRGRVSEVIEAIDGRRLKGEVTLVLRTLEITRESSELAAEIEALLKRGLRVKEVVRALSKEFAMTGSELYKEALKVKAATKI